MSLLVNWSQAWSNVYKSRTLKKFTRIVHIINYHWLKLQIWRMYLNLTNTLWDNAKKLDGDLKHSKSCTYFIYENVEEH